MTANSPAASRAAANPLARFTAALFGLLPISLTMLALRFALSQDITAAVPPGEPELFKMAVEVAGKFRPLSIEELDQLRQTAKTIKPIFPH